VKKELDLFKFFKRNRMQSLAIFALLNWRQKHLVSKLSNVELKAPIPPSSGSSDGENTKSAAVGSNVLKPISLKLAIGSDLV